MAIARLSVAASFVVAIGLAAVLMRVGAPVGVAATSGVFLVGLTLWLAGRAVTNRTSDPEGATGALMIVPGFMMLFVTAVGCLLLGKEHWPQANALLLFGGGVVAVTAVAALGNVVIDRIAPPRTVFNLADTSSQELDGALRQVFFGDPADGDA
jgi:hypothetical protein